MTRRVSLAEVLAARQKTVPVRPKERTLTPCKAYVLPTDKLKTFFSLMDQGKTSEAKSLFQKPSEQQEQFFSLGLVVSRILSNQKYQQVVDLITELYSSGNQEVNFSLATVNQLEDAIIQTRYSSPYQAALMTIKVFDANLPIKIKAQVVINTTSDLLRDDKVDPNTKLKLYEEIVRRGIEGGYVTKSIAYLRDSITHLEDPNKFFGDKLNPQLVEKAKQTAASLKLRMSLFPKST